MHNETSSIAYKEQEQNGDNARMRELIMTYFKSLHCGTQHDIARHLTIDSNKIHKRLSELEKEGLIYKSNIAEKHSNGKLCYVWVYHEFSINICCNWK